MTTDRFHSKRAISFIAALIAIVITAAALTGCSEKEERGTSASPGGTSSFSETESSPSDASNGKTSVDSSVSTPFETDEEASCSDGAFQSASKSVSQSYDATDDDQISENSSSSVESPETNSSSRTFGIPSNGGYYSAKN